jgi:protein-tyrosine phosphatase
MGRTVRCSLSRDWLALTRSFRTALKREEISDLGLQREAGLCRASGIEFVSFPIPDRGVPDVQQTLEIARSIAGNIAGGRSVAVHCRAGIGRSSMIAACAMICSGIEVAEALTLIRAARGVIVPDTEEQRDWIIAFGKTSRAQPSQIA